MSVQRLVALRGPGSGVASRIGFSNIGFNLDDGTGGEKGSVPMDEHLAKEVSSDFERGTVIEPPRQAFHGCFTLPLNAEDAEDAEERRE